MFTGSFELKPVWDRAKSFYGKAVVRMNDNGDSILTSYVTDVAMIKSNGEFLKLWDGYSATTARHIHEFRLQHGLKGISKKEWEELDTAF